jgi:NAD(P)-dependent dehydrogenase (short-subunit alcohol dehydrogenase family)
MDLNGKTFLVIGGSGVLGQQLTIKLHESGAQVLATASSNESAARISAVASVRLLLNLEQPESIVTLAEYLNAADSGLDGVINAAGVVAFGRPEEVDWQVQHRLLQINALGPAQLFSSLLPALAKAVETHNEAVIVNLSGVVAEQAFPGLAAYSASKSAIRSYLESLQRDWRRNKVRVLDARPGHTETGLATRAIAGTAPPFPAGLTPESVATRIIAGIVQGEVDLPATAFQ